MPVPLRFALVTDTHYWLGSDVADSSLWNRQLFTRSQELGERLSSVLKSLGLDFIIHAGDLTHQGDALSLNFAAQVMNSAGVPVYASPGNHDTGEISMRAQLAAAFSSTLLQPDALGMSYRLDIGALELVVLDSNSVVTKDGREDFDVHWLEAKREKYHLGPSQKGLCWLDGVLGGLGEKRALLVVHHPLVGKEKYPRRLPHDALEPEQRMVVPDDVLFARHCHELRALLQRHASSIAAVFSGHWHINDYFFYHGIPIMQTCSLMEFPFEFRVFELTAHKLQGDMHSIATPELLATSLVSEWKNAWVGGDESARSIHVEFVR